jgi:hypothetical protein
MRLSISPNAVLNFAEENNFSVVFFSTFEDYRQEELRNKLKLVNKPWSLLKNVVSLVTFGKIKADSTSYVVVLEKNIDKKSLT